MSQKCQNCGRPLFPFGLIMNDGIWYEIKWRLGRKEYEDIKRVCHGCGQKYTVRCEVLPSPSVGSPSETWAVEEPAAVAPARIEPPAKVPTVLDF